MRVSHRCLTGDHHGCHERFLYITPSPLIRMARMVECTSLVHVCLGFGHLLKGAFEDSHKMRWQRRLGPFGPSHERLIEAD